jgi:hypothetical protein
MVVGLQMVLLEKLVEVVEIGVQVVEILQTVETEDLLEEQSQDLTILFRGQSIHQPLRDYTYHNKYLKL